MPEAPSHGGDAGAARVQGGTSVQAGGNNTWMFLVGGGAVVAALIVFLASRGGDDDSKPGPAPSAVDRAPPPGGAGPTMRREIIAPQPTAPANSAPDPVVDHRAEAGRMLLSRLESARMWSTVEVEGAGLAIKSGYCEEPAMRQTIDAVVADLTQSGVKIVTCYERHGPKVFELPLSGAGGAP